MFSCASAAINHPFREDRVANKDVLRFPSHYSVLRFIRFKKVTPNAFDRRERKRSVFPIKRNML